MLCLACLLFLICLIAYVRMMAKAICIGISPFRDEPLPEALKTPLPPVTTDAGNDAQQNNNASEGSIPSAAPISLPVVETLNKLPEVIWDRFAGDGIKDVSVYGWLHRDDGKSDYVLVMIDKDGPWLISTSSAKYSADFSARLGMGGSGHTPCRRVEDHFAGVRCVRLKNETSDATATVEGVSAVTCYGLELVRALLMYAVDPVLCANGNSYVNACTEQWLDHASSLGAYPKEGPFVGNLEEVREVYQTWLDENGGLPEWPDSPNWLKRMCQNEINPAAGSALKDHE